MRKVTRMMLVSAGVRSIFEASDGIMTLDLIRSVNPDVLLLDWDLDALNGFEVIRIVRSPGVFPKAHLPIVMLTARGERSTVRTALKLGVHEFLLKPTSPKALRNRLLSIVVNPRDMVRIDGCYVPAPRTTAAPFDDRSPHLSNVAALPPVPHLALPAYPPAGFSSARAASSGSGLPPS